MEKKYFFFDIDGTLTERKTRKIVPSAQQALKELVDNGHFVAIATGRAHYKARNFMEEVGLHNMVCCGGGGLVINDELLVNTPLELEKAIAICNQAESLGYGVLLQLDDSIDVYAKNDLFIKQVGERQEPTRYFYDESLDYNTLEKIFKIYISIPQDKEYELTLKDTLGNLRFVQEYLMFQYDAKKEGIENMMKMLNADVKDVVVFGDDYNDMVMFDKRWFSIAMGNACDDLKQMADYVTDENIHNGIYKACKKFNWI